MFAVVSRPLEPRGARGSADTPAKRERMHHQLFSDEELREIEKRTADRLKEPIDVNQPERAKRIAERVDNEFLSTQGLYPDSMTAIERLA